MKRHDKKSPGEGEDGVARPGRAAILAASPRKRGNCDTAAAICESALKDAGVDVTLLYLREFVVKPCVSCGVCREPGLPFPRPPAGGEDYFNCPLGRADDLPALLDLLLAADRILVISPIYFYHLPASFKAFLDRLQAFWREDAPAACGRGAGQPVGEAACRSMKPCGTILIAGRKTGDKLFEGSLLTLKYALANLDVSVGEPLLLRGLDGPNDLADSPECRSLVGKYARTFARPPA